MPSTWLVRVEDTRYLRFHAWLAVLLGVALAKVLVLLLLPNSPMMAAPDEGTYADLARAVAEGEAIPDWRNGWGASLFPSVRVVVLPIASLIRVGLDPLMAARLMSVLWGLGASLLLLALVYLYRTRLGRTVSGVGIAVVSWQSASLAALTFMPSHALWSTLGLKDSATEFWMALSVLLLAILLQEGRVWARVMLALGLWASLVALFQVRDYLAAALILSMVATTVWRVNRRWTVSLLGLCALAAGMFVGMRATSSLIETSSRVREHAILTPQTIGDPSAVMAAGGVTREQMAAGANSAFDGPAGGAGPTGVRCGEIDSSASRAICEIRRLPEAALRLAIRPLWPIDRSATGSASYLYASVENYLWIGLFLGVLVCLAGWRQPVKRITTVLLVYASFLVIGLAFLEGNAGTGFRHKSQLLWVLAAVLLLSGDRREWLRRRRHYPKDEPTSLTAPAG
jgi:hypothetical protein